MLKELFPGIKLNPEDLLLLDSFQIKYLPDRVPEKEFSVLLNAYPVVKRYFVSKYPPIEGFINSVLKKHKSINAKKIDEYCQELLWEIADLIIYTKYPGLFDANTKFNWNIQEIISVKSIEGKIVVDAGAGTGKLAFLAAQFADTVFAVEPVTSMRQFIRDTARNNNVKNVYPLDGFLDSIPLPDNSVDILMTSNAIGWNLLDELMEIERVVKPNGYAIHLFRVLDDRTDNPLHNILISLEWGYSYTEYKGQEKLKFKYQKNINK